MFAKPTRLLALLLAFLPLPALAADVEWTEIHSPHFTVLSDAGEREARRVATQFERMRALFQIVLPKAADDAAAPIVVIALRDRKGFRTLEPEAYLGKNALDLAGYFMPGQDRNFVLLRLDIEGDHPYATIYHEYTHYTLRKTGEWMPLWLGEGLAEFYQNATLQEKNTLLGQPSGYDIEYLRQNRLLPIETLLRVDHESPYYHDEQKGSVFYSESWALTHYIQVTDRQNGTNHLGQYAALLSQHHDPVAAARQVFGDLKLLEKELAHYVQRMSFSEFRLTVPLTFSESSFTVRHVPMPEVDAVRADVLVNTRRFTDAQVLLESVLRADPNNARAHETMGLLKFRQNDLTEARRWYGQAVRLDSQSYLANYYFAVMSLSAGDRDHDDLIEQSLKTSIKLNAKFAPAYDSLAQFYASRHEKLDEAHVLNANAVQLVPESLPYRLNTAMVLAENELVDNAIRVLEGARPLAKTLDETGMIDHRISELERMTKSMEEAKTRRDHPENEKLADTIQTNGAGASVPQPAPPSEPEYPAGESAGPHHTASGVIRNVRCAYPTLLLLDLVGPAKTTSLYTSNYFKTIFTTANFEPAGELVPCSQIQGMKAKVEFAEVKDSRVAGQLLSVELSR